MQQGKKKKKKKSENERLNESYVSNSIFYNGNYVTCIQKNIVSLKKISPIKNKKASISRTFDEEFHPYLLISHVYILPSNPDVNKRL